MLVAANYGDVADIEVLWTLIALGGACFSIYNLRGALRDRSALIRAGLRNGRRAVANAQCRLEWSRLVCQAIFFAVGVMSMLLPDPPAQIHQPTKYVVAGALVRWGFIVAASLLTFQSFTNWRLRHLLNEVYAVPLDTRNGDANGHDGGNGERTAPAASQ